MNSLGTWASTALHASSVGCVLTFLLEGQEGIYQVFSLFGEEATGLL